MLVGTIDGKRKAHIKVEENANGNIIMYNIMNNMYDIIYVQHNLCTTDHERLGSLLLVQMRWAGETINTTTKVW